MEKMWRSIDLLVVVLIFLASHKMRIFPPMILAGALEQHTTTYRTFLLGLQLAPRVQRAVLAAGRSPHVRSSKLSRLEASKLSKMDMVQNFEGQCLEKVDLHLFAPRDLKNIYLFRKQRVEYLATTLDRVAQQLSQIDFSACRNDYEIFKYPTTQLLKSLSNEIDLMSIDEVVVDSAQGKADDYSVQIISAHRRTPVATVRSSQNTPMDEVITHNKLGSAEREPETDFVLGENAILTYSDYFALIGGKFEMPNILSSAYSTWRARAAVERREVDRQINQRERLENRKNHLSDPDKFCFSRSTRSGERTEKAQFFNGLDLLSLARYILWNEGLLKFLKKDVSCLFSDISNASGEQGKAPEPFLDTDGQYKCEAHEPTAAEFWQFHFGPLYEDLNIAAASLFLDGDDTVNNVFAHLDLADMLHPPTEYVRPIHIGGQKGHEFRKKEDKTIAPNKTRILFGSSLDLHRPAPLLNALAERHANLLCWIGRIVLEPATKEELDSFLEHLDESLSFVTGQGRRAEGKIDPPPETVSDQGGIPSLYLYTSNLLKNAKNLAQSIFNTIRSFLSRGQSLNHYNLEHTIAAYKDLLQHKHYQNLLKSLKGHWPGGVVGAWNMHISDGAEKAAMVRTFSQFLADSNELAGTSSRPKLEVSIEGSEGGRQKVNKKSRDGGAKAEGNEGEREGEKQGEKEKAKISEHEPPQKTKIEPEKTTNKEAQTRTRKEAEKQAEKEAEQKGPNISQTNDHSEQYAVQYFDYGNGKKVAIVLLDIRSETKAWGKGQQSGMLLSERQWVWLEEVFRRNEAFVHIIVSPIQVLAKYRFPLMEGWEAFGASRDRLLSLMLSSGVSGPILVSSGTGAGEVSRVKCARGEDFEPSDSHAQDAIHLPPRYNQFLYQTLMGWGRDLHPSSKNGLNQNENGHKSGSNTNLQSEGKEGVGEYKKEKANESPPLLNYDKYQLHVPKWVYPFVPDLHRMEKYLNGEEHQEKMRKTKSHWEMILQSFQSQTSEKKIDEANAYLNKNGSFIVRQIHYLYKTYTGLKENIFSSNSGVKEVEKNARGGISDFTDPNGTKDYFVRAVGKCVEWLGKWDDLYLHYWHKLDYYISASKMAKSIAVPRFSIPIIELTVGSLNSSVARSSSAAYSYFVRKILGGFLPTPSTDRDAQSGNMIYMDNNFGEIDIIWNPFFEQNELFEDGPNLGPKLKMKANEVAKFSALLEREIGDSTIYDNRKWPLELIELRKIVQPLSVNLHNLHQCASVFLGGRREVPGSKATGTNKSVNFPKGGDYPPSLPFPIEVKNDSKPIPSRVVGPTPNRRIPFKYFYNFPKLMNPAVQLVNNDKSSRGWSRTTLSPMIPKESFFYGDYVNERRRVEKYSRAIASVGGSAEVTIEGEYLPPRSKTREAEDARMQSRHELGLDLRQGGMSMMAPALSVINDQSRFTRDVLEGSTSPSLTSEDDSTNVAMAAERMQIEFRDLINEIHYTSRVSDIPGWIQLKVRSDTHAPLTKVFNINALTPKHYASLNEIYEHPNKYMNLNQLNAKDKPSLQGEWHCTPQYGESSLTKFYIAYYLLFIITFIIPLGGILTLIIMPLRYAVYFFTKKTSPTPEPEKLHMRAKILAPPKIKKT